jgi:DNA (cytosine-5)-methyltransferase 1
VDASRFGVPQKRTRLIVIGLRKGIARSLEGGTMQVFKLLEKMRITYLGDLGLPESVSACDALSDLTTKWHFKQPCVDPYSPKGFEEIVYDEPSSTFQKLMHKGCRKDAMDSMRLARHGDVVRERFARILEECPRGVRMNEANREQYSTKKHRDLSDGPVGACPYDYHVA